MKINIFLIFFAVSFFLKGQNLNCDNLEFNIKSDFRTEIKSINNLEYNTLLKDSIIFQHNNSINIDSLQIEFDKKYKNFITKRCIKSKLFINETKKISSYKECNENQQIKLVNKIHNFYIFNLKSFEINNYLLFNTINNTIYLVNS